MIYSWQDKFKTKDVNIHACIDKGRYALRTMVDLAIHGDGEPVKIKT